MLKDILGVLAIIAVHTDTLLVLKTDLCNADMSSLPLRMIASPLFIGTKFLVIIIFSFIEIMTVIFDFL